MKKTTTTGWMLLAFSMLTGTTFVTSCSTDDNIDLGDLDKTIGIGGDGFVIPGGSAKDTRLGDVLDIKNSDVIDTTATGDYYFSKGDTIDPAKPKVKQVVLKNPSPNPGSLPVYITTAMEAYLGQDKTVWFPNDGDFSKPSDPKKVASFSFDGDPNDQIVSLTEADVDGNVTLTIGLKQFNGKVTLATLELFIPKFINVDEADIEAKGYEIEHGTTGIFKDFWILRCVNVPTDKNLAIPLKVTKFTGFVTKKEASWGEDDPYLLFDQNGPELNAVIKMRMKLNAKDFQTGCASITPYEISTGLTLSENINLTHAEGYFDPDININESHVDINDIPDFLNDERVSIKLYNPQIVFEINNNIDVEADVTGTLTATYNDGSKKKIDVTKGGSEMIVMKKASVTKKNKIVICRYKPANPDPNTQYIELRGTGTKTDTDGKTLIVEDIANILNKIPDFIDFNFDAHANTNVLGAIDLYKEGTEDVPGAPGTGYEIEPIYEFSAPLALETGSVIVYNDSINDWNKDIKDNKIDFYDDASIIVEAEVNNNTPLDQLVINKPQAIGVERDAQGYAKIINDAKVELLDENGNVLPKGLVVDKNGNKMLRMKVSGTLENLDGVKFEVQAKTTSGSPEALNTQKHTINIKDIKIKLTGRLTIDVED